MGATADRVEKRAVRLFRLDPKLIDVPARHKVDAEQVRALYAERWIVTSDIPVPGSSARRSPMWNQGPASSRVCVVGLIAVIIT